METNYRTRIYNAYNSSGRQEGFLPADQEELSPRLPILQKLVRQHLPPDLNASILELGCGHGALIHVARQAGYRKLRGVDGSPEQVALARQLKIEGIVQGEILDALGRLQSGSWDCVVAFDLIEHFKKAELIALVDEVFRILKAGGRWIIHTPNGESPFVNRILFGDFIREIAFTRTSMAQLMFSSGFSRLKCYEDSPVRHGIKSTIRWIMWQSIRSLLRLYIAAETGDASRDAIFSQNLLAVAIK